jgi:hypothetical protein
MKGDENMPTKKKESKDLKSPVLDAVNKTLKKYDNKNNHYFMLLSEVKGDKSKTTVDLHYVRRIDIIKAMSKVIKSLKLDPIEKILVVEHLLSTNKK